MSDVLVPAPPCPKCHHDLVRHCANPYCGWFPCLNDKMTWVLTIIRNPNQQPVPLWNSRPFLVKPIPPLSQL